MNIYRRLAFVLVAAITALGTSLVINSRHDVDLSEVEADENPAARLEWEFARLRDPATNTIPEGIRAKELAYAATLPVRESQGAMFKSAGIADYSWQWRGPYNIGGRTLALAADVTGEDTLLAGGVSGGLWRSTNGGTSWTRTTTLSQLPSVSCIVQDVRTGKTNNWYYGTGELVGASPSAGGAYYDGDGIFKSTDNGHTWSQLTATRSGTPQTFDKIYDFIWNLGMDRSDTGKGEVYAALYGTIARSSDGGTSWREVLGGSNPQTQTYTGYYTDVAVTSTGVVYATISSDGWRKGIWRSTDGVKWTKITPAFWTDSLIVNRTVIGIAPSNENVVYFLAETPGTGHKGLDFKKNAQWSSLWKYTYQPGDSTGANSLWEDRTANLPSFGGSFGDFNPQASYNLHVHVKPDDENVVFVGGTNLYRSTDGFTTAGNTKWIGGYHDVQIDSMVIQEYEYINHHPDQHALIFSRKIPSMILSGSDGGVHKTLDGFADSVTWTSLNNGYATSQFYTVAIDHAASGGNLVVGGLQDNGTWRTSDLNASTPWVRTGSGDGAYCSVVDGGLTMYVSKQEGKAYRVLLDGSGNMTASTRIDPLGGTNYEFINPFTLDPSDQKIMYMAGGHYLWRNSDLTAIPLGSTQPATTNWMRLDSVQTTNNSRVTAISVSTESPSHRVYVGTDSGRVYRIENADVGNPTALDVTGTSFPKKGYVSCVAVDPLDGNKAMVVFSNYIVQSLFYTTDAGKTWSPVGGNLEQNRSLTGAGNGPSCRWASILHRANGTIYLVATSTGLYSSIRLDSMRTTWALEGASMIGNNIVDMIDARQSDGFVAVGTHGAGMFSTTIGTVGVDETRIASQGASLLDQNVPNPVTTSTTIRFTVPSLVQSTVPVRLKLYDARGEELLTLIDDRRAPGSYSTTFDVGALPGRLPGGTYFYRLQVGDAIETKSMQVMR